MRRLLPILLLCVACAYGKTLLESPKGKESRESLPPKVSKTVPQLSLAGLYPPGYVPPVVSVAPPPPPGLASVTLVWNNVTNSACPENAIWLHSNLFATTNLAAPLSNWTQVARLPFLQFCKVTLTNRPSHEFYRVSAVNDNYR